METERLKRLLQARGVGFCSCGIDLGVQPVALSLSPQTHHNNIWDLILAHSVWAEVLISCSCRVFLLISLVFPVFNTVLHHYFTYKMTMIFSKRGYQPNRVLFSHWLHWEQTLQEGNCKFFVACCWMNIPFSEQGFCKPVGTLSIWQGVPVSKQIWSPISGCVGCFLEDGTFKICPCKHDC